MDQYVDDGSGIYSFFHGTWDASEDEGGQAAFFNRKYNDIF